MVRVVHPAQCKDEEIPRVFILLQVSDLPSQGQVSIHTWKASHNRRLIILSFLKPSVDIRSVIILFPPYEAGEADRYQAGEEKKDEPSG